MIKPFNINTQDIDALQGESVEHIASYVSLKIPSQIIAPINWIFISSSDNEQKRATFHKNNTEIAMIVDDTAYELILQISDKHITNLTLNQLVDVKIPAINQTLKGYVKNIASYPKKLGSNYNYTVIVNFDDIDTETVSQLKVGMNCSVSVTLDEQDVILIPLTAVKSIFNQNIVFTKTNGASAPTEVTLGRTYGMNVQVLSGLNVGDEILDSA